MSRSVPVHSSVVHVCKNSQLAWIVQSMSLSLSISQKCRPMNIVKMVVCSIPAVVDITIVRPDLKYQLGFSVHEGMVCQ